MSGTINSAATLMIWTVKAIQRLTPIPIADATTPHIAKPNGSNAMDPNQSYALTRERAAWGM